MNDGWYFPIGGVFAVLSGGVTFIGAWAYCAMTYGFLFGFGLGWMPAGILAFIVGGLVWLLWLPILILLAALWAGILHL